MFHTSRYQERAQFLVVRKPAWQIKLCASRVNQAAIRGMGRASRPLSSLYIAFIDTPLDIHTSGNNLKAPNAKKFENHCFYTFSQAGGKNLFYE